MINEKIWNKNTGAQDVGEFVDFYHMHGIEDPREMIDRHASVWHHKIPEAERQVMFAEIYYHLSPRVNYYATINDSNEVTYVYTSEHDAGHPEVRDHFGGSGLWVYVEEPCFVGDVLDVDDDGCATVLQPPNPDYYVDDEGHCIDCGHPADNSSGHGTCGSPAHS